jgi:uncharacterized protein YwqG
MTRLQDITIEAEKRSLYMDWTYAPSAHSARTELNTMGLLVTPDSPVYRELSAAIHESNLSEVGPVILNAARDAVQMETTSPDDYANLGNSRFGGFPDLTDPELFPKTDGLYWMFLVQLNLADLAPFNSYLPRSGLLSFFVDSTEQLNAKVLFYQGAMNALTKVSHDGEACMISPDDDYTTNPHCVRFRRIFSLPHRVPRGIVSESQCEAYEDSKVLHVGTDHQINGYTYTQHESPQEQAANTLRGQPDEWVPLLQLGWDGKVGFCFWDAGTLTFTIHQEDLRRWDFSRVHVSLESS